MKRTETEMLSDFIGGISTMIDASTQIVHARMNPKFMAIRDMLNTIKDDVVNLMKGK
jgi:hypothetical protein